MEASIFRLELPWTRPLGILPLLGSSSWHEWKMNGNAFPARMNEFQDGLQDDPDLKATFILLCFFFVWSCWRHSSFLKPILKTLQGTRSHRMWQTRLKPTPFVSPWNVVSESVFKICWTNFRTELWADKVSIYAKNDRNRAIFSHLLELGGVILRQTHRFYRLNCLISMRKPMSKCWKRIVRPQ